MLVPLFIAALLATAYWLGTRDTVKVAEPKPVAPAKPEPHRPHRSF